MSWFNPRWQLPRSHSLTSPPAAQPAQTSITYLSYQQERYLTATTSRAWQKLSFFLGTKRLFLPQIYSLLLDNFFLWVCYFTSNFAFHSPLLAVCWIFLFLSPSVSLPSIFILSCWLNIFLFDLTVLFCFLISVFSPVQSNPFCT